jgi:hypothetical protein
MIHDVDYLAIDSAAVYTHNRGDPRLGLTGYANSGHEISHNTLYNSARGLIVHEKSQSLKILNNHIYNGGLQTSDSGFTYTWGTDGGWTEIAYNWMHDQKSPKYGNGIYLDNDVSNFLVHHNVVWNIPACALVANDPPTNQHFYNNTIWNASNGGICGDGSGVQAYNNLSNDRIDPSDSQNNLITSNPGFVNASGGDFHLQSTSPAIDYGRQISGITDGFVGSAPDAGAYELGATWTAGANISSSPTPTPTAPAP